ncbi:MAG: hypothetical protein ACD_47C00058G0003 [uncultured bacterium]|nr:MAG: hypothetical protein ACD_47C00058G0003 [uncultured bacterium]
MAVKKKTQEIIPTLLIGVGGSGYKTLKAVKQKFIESGQYSNKVPPMINFLCIDTDPNTLNETVFTTSEKLILTADTSKILGNINQFPYIKSWFPAHRIKQTISSGARQIRALGRLSLFANIDDILDSIKKAINNICDKKWLSGDIIRTNDSVAMHVYIVGSVCGGTGSGMFVDISYIVRQLIELESMIQPEIFGYLSMPDALVNISDSSLVRIKANSAASLKEIDLFMDGGEVFSTQYSDNFKIANNIGMLKPYNFCYLISGVDINEQDTIVKVEAEQIFHSLGAGTMQDTNKSYYSNIPTTAFKPIASGEFIGKITNYSSLGVSSCAIPMEKITGILSNRFASDLMNALLEYSNPKNETTPPWEELALRFIQNNGFEIDSQQELKVLNKLYDITKTPSISPSKHKEFKISELCDILNQDEVYYASQHAKLKKDIGDKKAQLETDLIKNYAALLNNSMGDADQGVGIAAKTSIRIYQMLEQFRSKLCAEKSSISREYSNLKHDASKHKVFVEEESLKMWVLRNDRNIHSNCEEWTDSMNAAFKKLIQGERRDFAIEAIDQLMNTIKSNVDELKKFKENVKFLKDEVFVKNATFTGESLNEGESSWLLDYPIIETSDLDRIYRKYIDNPNIYETAFVGKQEGLNIIEKWPYFANNQADFKIKILEYAVKVIENQIKDLTIENFLTEKSSVTGEDEIKKAGEALALKGKPLWQINKGIYPAVMQKLNILGVYDKETTKISGHVRNILQNKHPVVSTKDPHSITLVQTEHGAPLFAISKIEEWESTYNKLKKVEFLHAITEEEYKIDWENYPFRPITFDKQEALKFFTLGESLNFIQRIEIKGKISYYCTKDCKTTVNASNKEDIFLGYNRLDAFESFAASQYVRKMSVLIGKTLDDMGGYRDQMQHVYKHAKDLKDYMEQIDNPDLQQLISAEIRSLVPLLKELDAKRSLQEAESKNKKARAVTKR